MTISAKTPIKSASWFNEAPAAPAHGGIGSLLAKFAVCVVAGLLLWLTHHTTFAIVVWVIGLAVLAICLISPAARLVIDGALAAFGRVVGTIVGGMLLAVLYLFAFTPARLIRRMTGADDLHLRDGNRTSFWLACDNDVRKVRYVSTMFATEAPTRRGRPLVTIAIVVVGLLVISELALRVMHYGEPITYVADPLIGYYPSPNMTVQRSGGLIHTNQFGMRSRDIDAKKPAGVFRILMLGDSTLYGGSYIDQKDLYSARLDAQLNQRAGGKVEVLAMGCNGWGPFHERGYVAHYGTFDADLAIINLPVDDINRPLYGLMDVPFFAQQNPPTLALEEVMNHFIWIYRSRHSGLDGKWEAQQSQIGIQEYGKLIDDLKKQGCEVIVAILPSREAGFGAEDSPTDTKWRTELQQVIADHGVKSWFAKGWFTGKGTPEELYHDDMHLMAPGHHAYADFLESRVVADSQKFQDFLKGAK
jgi:hypothetical protein